MIGATSGNGCSCGAIEDLPDVMEASSMDDTSLSFPEASFDAVSDADADATCFTVDSCDAGRTTLRGHVLDPAGRNPVFHAVVYVPSCVPLSPIVHGPSCDPCNVAPTGGALSIATTDASGSFELVDVPSGPSVPLVVQLGKWRRVTTIANVTACQPNDVADDAVRLPRDSSEGDLPTVAYVVGVDHLECILRKIGIAASELGGSVRVLTGATSDAGLSGVKSAGTFAHALETDGGLDSYDAIVESCEGTFVGWTPAQQQALRGWAARGGRLLIDDFSLNWVDPGGTSPWSVALQSGPHDVTGLASVDVDTPKGQAMFDWLAAAQALTDGGIPVQFGSLFAWSVTNRAREDLNKGGDSLLFHFAPPLGGEIDGGSKAACGRVEYFFGHFGYDTSWPACSDPYTAYDALAENRLLEILSCTQDDALAPVTPPKQ